MNLQEAKIIVDNLPDELIEQFKTIQYISFFNIPIKFTSEDFQRIGTSKGLDKQVKRLHHKMGYIFYIDSNRIIHKFIHENKLGSKHG